jgi:choline dehydrogenase-like flavoprotein
VVEDFDIIIVGSGAGGGTLAHTLAHTGKRILILERGGFLPGGPGGRPGGPGGLGGPAERGEPGGWDPPPLPGADSHAETWFDAHGRPFPPAAHYYVGGATKLYDAALSRLRPMDFGRVIHMDGPSPAWPLSYAEFEPWYARAEWLYQVHGLHGEDPTEGSWSAEYLWPPVTHEPVIQQLAHELTRAGYQPFHTPTGVLLDERSPADSRCVRCAGCQGLPCLLHAKADADVIAVRPLLGLRNVTLLVNAEVTRLETDSRGRSVTGVVVNRAGNREVYRGGIVVLAAGAVNSARILLGSACDGHPNGLANGSGQVGRNLMCHNHIDVAATVREPHVPVFPQTLGVNDFYLGGRDARWPLGGIQLLGVGNGTGNGAGNGGATGAGRRAAAPSVPRPRAAAAAQAHAQATDRDHGEDAGHAAIAFRLTTEDLPRPANRVTVDGQGRLSLAHVPTGDGVARLLYRSLRAMLSGTRMIAQEIRDRPVKPDATRRADYAGTCRFGADPATSVLDANCKAHELDNLYVVDASFFPSIGAVSPALTVMANAIRVGEHLASRLGCRPSSREKPRRNLAVTEAIC